MKIGISGGNGDLSNKISKQLLANGFPPSQLVVTSTRPEELADLADRGIDVKKADFSDTASVSKAFTGCDRVLLISIKDHLFDIKGKEYHANAVAGCVSAGVKHIMYTSAIGAFRSGDDLPSDVHADAERQMEDSGCDYTVIRNGAFIEALESKLKIAINEGGIFHSAAADGRCSWVSKSDIARATAIILTLDAPSKLYTLTGAEAVSLPEIIGAVNDLFGTKIIYESMHPDAYAHYFDEKGVEEVVKRHMVFI